MVLSTMSPMQKDLALIMSIREKMKSKSLIVSAHQPNFMPTLGYFYKMSLADKFIVITNIQFERQEGWQKRNRILTKNGGDWLTIHVIGSQNQIIRDVKINNNTNWQKKHKKTLVYNYGKSSEREFFDSIIKLYERKWERLADFNFAIIKLIKETLEIDTELIFDEDVCGQKQDLLISICKKYNAHTYLSGEGAKSYMTTDYLTELEKNNLKHEFIKNPASNHFY